MLTLEKLKEKKGFTIIETMVAISLFLVVVMFGMTALLNANVIYKKLHDMRSIIDNVSFIMEDMSKNMRVGYGFHCFMSNESLSPPDVNTISNPQSCATGGAVAFEFSATGLPANKNDQWVYKITSQDGGLTYKIWKSTDSGATWSQLNPDEVKLDSYSGFSVLGALPSGSGAGYDSQQPLIIIRLSGRITYKGVDTPFSIQTSVSQRAVDT